MLLQHHAASFNVLGIVRVKLNINCFFYLKEICVKKKSNSNFPVWFGMPLRNESFRYRKSVGGGGGGCASSLFAIKV